MNPLALLRTYASTLLAVFGLIGWMAAGWQTVRVSTNVAALAKEQRARAQEHAQAEEQARITSENYRRQEAADALRLREKQEAYDALQKSHAEALAGQRAALADNGRLRNALAAYARGSDPASDTASAASARAAALGELLAEALRLDAENAEAAESNGDAVRALLEAWPH